MKTLRDIKILVVDDEVVMRDVLKRSLTIAGAHVWLATDGIDGLEQLQTRKMDVIVSDIKMPLMDGISFSQEALRQQPGVPILLITGYAESYSKQQFKKIGITDLIAKPFRNTVIVNTIRAAVDAARAQEDSRNNSPKDLDV